MHRARWLLGAAVVAAGTAASLGAGMPTALDRFEDVRTETYSHAAPGFSIEYPYALRSAKPSRNGEVFSASGPARAPALSVVVLPRPAELTLAQAAQAAAKQLAPNGTVKAQQTIDLGGVPGERVTFDWALPLGAGVNLRSAQVSAFHGNDWVIVTVTDGRAGDQLPPDLVATVDSLRFAP